VNMTEDIDRKASLFGQLVTTSFAFLERDHGMKRAAPRVSNRNEARDLVITVRYDSEEFRLDIAWGAEENALGILIWRKDEAGNSQFDSKKRFVYFEPFVEYLSGGSETPIIPPIFPGMSVTNMCRVMEERQDLFRSPLSELVDRLANRLRTHLPDIMRREASDFENFHKWFARHR